MEEYFYSSSSLPMANAAKITRKSIFTFLQNFQYFTSTPALIAFPFAFSTLVSQSLITSSHLFPLIHGRLRSLFVAAGIPPQSELFAILNLKLSQTILSFLFVFPFTLSFLLLAKASVIIALEHLRSPRAHTFFSWIAIFNRLVITHLCNSLLILSANATCFCLLSISFNLCDVLGLWSPRFLLLVSATGAIVYSIILANAYIICNLSLIVSGMEKVDGFNSILKACVVIRGRAGTALSLAVPMNMGLAGIEALFQYRVLRAYNRAVGLELSMVLEAMLIAFLYALIIVVDTIVGYVFLKSCKPDQISVQENVCSHQIEIEKRDEKSIRKVMALDSVF